MLTSPVRQERFGQASCLKAVRVSLTAFILLLFQFKTWRPNNMIGTFYDFLSFSTSATQYCSQYFGKNWHWQCFKGLLINIFGLNDSTILFRKGPPWHQHLERDLRKLLLCQQELTFCHCCSSSTALSACEVSNSWCVSYTDYVNSM